MCMLKRILHKLKAIYETNFILVIAIASTAYIHSSFLKSLGTPIPEGILFAFGSIAAVIATLLSPPLFERLGVEKTTSYAGIINGIALVLIALNISNTLSIIAFIIAIGTIALIVLGIDIVIEHLTEKNATGEIRGINLALGNLAFLIGPIVAGFIAEEFNLASVYLFAAVTTFCMVLFFHKKFRTINLFIKQKQKNVLRDIRVLFSNKTLRNSYISGFMVEFFFAIWAIFVTIYMHEIIGFNWEQIGILFALMHIPYIVLEPLIGDVADRYNNENILMIGGLIIIALSFVWITTLQTDNMTTWALALIISRVGASFGQVGHESFFFKKVSEKNTDLISAYRTMAPLALLLGPVAGSIALLLTDYQTMFLIVAFLLIMTIIPASKLIYER